MDDKDLAEFDKFIEDHWGVTISSNDRPSEVLKTEKNKKTNEE